MSMFDDMDAVINKFDQDAEDFVEILKEKEL